VASADIGADSIADGIIVADAAGGTDVVVADADSGDAAGSFVGSEGIAEYTADADAENVAGGISVADVVDIVGVGSGAFHDFDVVAVFAGRVDFCAGSSFSMAKSDKNSISSAKLKFGFECDIRPLIRSNFSRSEASATKRTSIFDSLTTRTRSGRRVSGSDDFSITIF
jgi:hypothetical protein